ncbi:MAG: polysaccharide biosynthesis/export family protein [Nitrospira sp.]|jgi:polysaccharide export outer membrane protein|nr:polysaccharide biosynthesis/export family protein [Nitrospira sp.]HQY58818.1 polysaccharide biosynthesis/export family protein [Nitrospira sp.]HRA95299.1 polysaccharide biosynthesis/export family protein [Nitrospira sp.]
MHIKYVTNFIVLLCAVSFTSVSLVGCAAVVKEREYEAPSGFLLGPEDLLEITVWKNADLSRITAIRPDGLISMPLIGDVQASGLTADGLAHRIAERLKQFVASNPAVSVSVKELNSYSIFVLGEVTKPGKYQAKSYVTLLQAISMGGGFTEYAKKNNLQVVRNRLNGDNKIHETRIPIRYDDLLVGRGEPGNMILLSGDTVIVP